MDGTHLGHPDGVHLVDNASAAPVLSEQGSAVSQSCKLSVRGPCRVFVAASSRLPSLLRCAVSEVQSPKPFVIPPPPLPLDPGEQRVDCARTRAITRNRVSIVT